MGGDAGPSSPPGPAALQPSLSVVLYAALLVLPVGRDEGPPRLVLGGYFCAGTGMVPANLLAWAGWVSLAQGLRQRAVVSGVLALLFRPAGVIPLALTCDVLAYPAFWVWLASFAVLTAGGLLLSRPGQAAGA